MESNKQDKHQQDSNRKTTIKSLQEEGWQIEYPHDEDFHILFRPNKQKSGQIQKQKQENPTIPSSPATNNEWVEDVTEKYLGQGFQIIGFPHFPKQ